jgi:hypothetical protein
MLYLMNRINRHFNEMLLKDETYDIPANGLAISLR